jgi:pilus assembly protein CpaB
VAIRNFLIALGAIAFIAGVMLVISRLAVSSRPQAMPAASAREAVLVAARPIAAGTLLRPEDVTWQDAPAAGVTPGSIARSQSPATEYFGALARRDFAAGEPLAASALVKSSERAFLSGVLSAGDRAIAVAVDAPQSAAGLVLPGDRVDLILMQSFAPEAADLAHRTVAETVVRNIRVIAVDQWVDTTAKPAAAARGLGSDAQIPRTVTLEVSDSEAERVLVAVQLGKIELAVRALERTRLPRDTADDVSAPIWASDVSPALHSLERGSARPAALLPASAGRAAMVNLPGSATAVEVMHGSKNEAR